LLRLFTAALLLAGFGVAPAFAQGMATPTGRWITADNQAVIQIAPCGKNLCGQIVGLAHAAGPTPKDWQGRPQCGLTILQTTPTTDDNGNPRWVGTVTDPRSGVIYHATVALDEFRHLLLHGYVLLPFLGKTQTWLPYAGRTLAGCQLASN
jgi:uncharacterized protein (DUF2147 family)